MVLIVSCAPAISTTPDPDGYTLRPALEAERRSLELPGFGKVSYYANPRGTGRPLILTHAVNAAASAYEMKPVWEMYAGIRPLFALEWPGFGSSDRPDLQYTPELMSQALLELVKQIGGEVDVVALSLGSEFAARAALAEPRIKTLVLISPSGFGTPTGTSQEASEQDGGNSLYGFLAAIGDPLFGLLSTRFVLEFFLDRSFRGPVPADIVDYALETTRQPGARFAPIYFVSGRLFTRNAYDRLYDKLTIPVLVLYDQDGFVSFDSLSKFAQKPNASVVRIPETDGLPHFEKPAEVQAALGTFWSKAYQLPSAFFHQ
ncbi:MAG: alpha/beta hydrolase [Meiothermus sp.]|uniref:Alpha/beta hydrolase n=2 Tax=Meiothermus hypogaeus TaxID=884155 RepID=A0A511QYN2_9DEIN|nr:alpha/beta hydrolase [Meiothermus hypogaeus]RIH81010.1 Alpha/beta hydrolase family protein [Meiothermus hypogaeus]GEM82494.1 alpha/beta hydrolase [Meiothermus hypogaeus NBRC 106114]GIW37891.1 MAG: alpha/beta hydrolase [Meiothermus sp.]